MRLIRTETLALREFSGRSIPPYAILSHTWTDGEEISLDDMQFLSCCIGQGREIRMYDDTGQFAALNFADHMRHHSLTVKSGYDKIKRCCEVASMDGFEYVWVDTCCIDKTSSAELSEAINSMYRWYGQAEVCYAYLSDVPVRGQLRVPDSVENGVSEMAFSSSRWFTRGWTLQELIAPSSVIFFNSEWGELGTKSSLREVICRITGIQCGILLGDDGLGSVSVAQRMSWASKRETTRVEDLAYCLMGIFDVFMPMLYGEGDRAFIRLQEEIIRKSNDHSILAWRGPALGIKDGGVFADSPAAFEHSGNFIRSKRFNPMSIGLTSRGVHLTVPSKYWANSSYLVILNCEDMGKPGQLLAIFLKKVFGDNFVRDRRDELTSVEKPEVMFRIRHDVYILQRKIEREVPSYPYSIEMGSLKEHGVSLYQTFPKSRHYSNFEFKADRNLLGALLFLCGDGTQFAVVLKTNGKSLSAIALECHQPTSDLLADIFESHVRRPETVDSRFDEKCYSDRTTWQSPDSLFRVTVAIKRKMICDERWQVVEINCVKAPKEMSTSLVVRSSE